MYNTPRATSVIALEESVLYSLDRTTFTHVVKDSSMQKREKYEEFLGRVELLQDLDPYERGSMCDVLIPKTIDAGEYVIKQGEQGDKFYFVEEGEAIAIIDKGIQY
jgi:cAMP-dependent protein kinase regulator